MTTARCPRACARSCRGSSTSSCCPPATTSCQMALARSPPSAPSTSRSSCSPRGPRASPRAPCTATTCSIAPFGLGAEDVVYVPSPLAHQTGFLYGMWIALRLGVPQVLQEVWDAETGLDAMRRFGVTFAQAATPFLADLTRVADERDERPERLRTFVATGAAIPRELARKARQVLGAEVGGA